MTLKLGSHTLSDGICDEGIMNQMPSPKVQSSFEGGAFVLKCFGLAFEVLR